MWLHIWGMYRLSNVHVSGKGNMQKWTWFIMEGDYISSNGLLFSDVKGSSINVRIRIGIELSII